LQSGSIGITWHAGSQLPHSGEMRLALPFIRWREISAPFPWRFMAKRTNSELFFKPFSSMIRYLWNEKLLAKTNGEDCAQVQTVDATLV